MGRIGNKKRIFLVVGLLVVCAGAASWHLTRKTPDPIRNASQANAADATTSLPKQAATPQQPATLGAATDWLSHCSVSTNACFTYPSNWTLSADDTTRLANSTKSVQINHGSVAGAYGSNGTVTYHVTSIDTLASDPDLRIIGGYETTYNVPSYAVVDQSFITSHSLAVGRTASNIPNPSYTDPIDGKQFAFFAYNAQVTAPIAAAAATEWFNTSDSKTALAMLQSLISKTP